MQIQRKSAAATPPPAAAPAAAPAAKPAERQEAAAKPPYTTAQKGPATLSKDKALTAAQDIKATRRAAMAPPASFDVAAANAKAGQINSLISGHTSRSDESKILQTLSQASGPELNHILSKVDKGKLLDDVDNHLLGPSNKTALLNLLAKDRLQDLSVASRAGILDAIQKEFFLSRGKDENKAILNIFLGTHGAELTDLKNRVDAGGDNKDLQELIFRDLKDDGMRAQILEHIQNEAKAGPPSGSKVLSDIDDTFYASLKDKSYPKKTVYPGVRQFYQELDRGAGATSDRMGDLGFLTARPWDPIGLMESQTHKLLKEHGVPDSTVLTGDLLHLLGNERIAEKKVDNFGEYHKLYPEAKAVFVGDSGQGDAIAGRTMVAKNPETMQGVFIHDVVNTPQAQRDEWRKQGVVFFDTYAGAAVEAYNKGLISKEGVARIAQSSIAEFGQVKFDSAEQRSAREAELRRDIALANALLPAGQKIQF